MTFKSLPLRWWEGSTGRTHLPDSKQKGRACSGTLQQRYGLKLGVVCIPGLEGRGMMVIMLVNKTTFFFRFFFQTSQTSLYLFLFVTCKLIALCECKQRSLLKLPQRHIYWSLSNFKRGRTTFAFNQYLEPENWSNMLHKHLRIYLFCHLPTYHQACTTYPSLTAAYAVDSLIIYVDS